jgi:hypothetical protein
MPALEAEEEAVGAVTAGDLEQNLHIYLPAKIFYWKKKRY